MTPRLSAARQMIIRRDKDAFLLIRQVDHARLAADLIAHWLEDGFPTHTRRSAILLAVREHDNGWLEEDDATHLSAEGEPLDFINVPSAVKHRIWPRATARVGGDHPYEAALVAEHALTVHGQQRTEPDWRHFFDTMESIKASLLARCEDRAAHLTEDYRFLQTADQLSLIFSNGWGVPFPRRGGRTILHGATLEITPDPFGGARVPLRVRAHRVPARPFASPADLKAALDEATVEIIEGEAVGRN